MQLTCNVTLNRGYLRFTLEGEYLGRRIQYQETVGIEGISFDKIAPHILRNFMGEAQKLEDEIIQTNRRILKGAVLHSMKTELGVVLED